MAYLCPRSHPSGFHGFINRYNTFIVALLSEHLHQFCCGICEDRRAKGKESVEEDARGTISIGGISIQESE